MSDYYIGLMSGTSADGIDAVLVRFGQQSVDIRKTVHTPFPAEVRDRIDALVTGGDEELHRASMLDIELAQLFASAVNSIMESAGLEPRQIRAIGSHGQTLRHKPGGPYPYTIQVGNPSVIAEQTGITVVADFRARDLAAGGQGAPLVPAFHNWLFRKSDTDRIIINIGGIANLTLLPSEKTGTVLGFDSGPGNTLLDGWVRRHRGIPFDEGGKWAEQGRCNEKLLKSLLGDPYFARPAPKSTGREYFSLDWLGRHMAGCGMTLAPADVQATLSDLTAVSIAQEVRRGPFRNGEIFLCGGGAHNLDLVGRIARELPEVSVATTSVLGLDPDWVEATAFGWLAHRTLEGLPGNIPTVTGAAHPVILGGIYPQGKL